VNALRMRGSPNSKQLNQQGELVEAAGIAGQRSWSCASPTSCARPLANPIQTDQPTGDGARHLPHGFDFMTF